MENATTGNGTNEQLIGDGETNRIDRVTLFTDQAYLTRVVKATAQAGLHRFAIEVAAHQVERDSTQARVFGAGEILSVQYREIPLREPLQTELRGLEEDQRRLKRQRAALERGREGLRRQATFLDSVATFAGVEVPREIKTAMPPVERLQELLGYLDHNSGDLAERDRALVEAIEELDRDLALVQRRLKQIKGDVPAAQKVIEVLFRSEREQSLRIEVSYLALRAGWSALYKVDIAEDHSRIGLTQFARITQQTGEEWGGVALTLSNAIPTRSGELPEPQSWYLWEQPKYRTPLPMAAMAGATAEVEGEMELDGLSLDEEPVAEAGFAAAAVRETGLSFEFDLPDRVTIPSGERESLMPLLTQAPRGELFHYTVPRLAPLVYLVCRLAADQALLAGRMNIHLGGRYIGSTALGERKAGETLLVSLGPDRGVRVAREGLTDQKSETFFGKVDRSTVGRGQRYRITLENLKPTPVRVQLLDGVPVSRTDRFQVKDVELDPAPLERDWHGREGVVCWELSLEPGATREIRITFEVRHPKDNPPQGL